MKTTLVIADDHEILRDALATHATGNTEFQVVASVGDAQSAVNACACHRPDLLLLDIEMPGRDALASISDVKAASPRTNVVILTAYCRDTFIELSLRSGVAGYLLKTDPPAAIFRALGNIATGGTAYSKQVLARISQRDSARTAEGGGVSRFAALTQREIEVLTCIGRGLDNEQMAQTMSLSKRTIERHVARLMDAVAIRDRSALVRFAYEHGLVV